MSNTYEHPRAALTVDCVVFGFDEGELKVLLIQRGLAPFAGKWALPGGFVRVEETLDDAALRELAEETGLTNIFLEQLYTFGTVNRDPRERVVSVAYYALVKSVGRAAIGGSDAAAAAWFPVAKLPALAFDHAEILINALTRLRRKVTWEPVGFELLPSKFTLSQLQHLYEAVLEAHLDKRNFRKKILATGLLVPLKESICAGAHRPAQLFRFDFRKYSALRKRGFHFEI